jgi:hypothetical protein
MDILAHMLWTNAGGKGLNTVLEKKEKSELKVNLAWTTFFGVFPDLFAFTIPFVIGIWNMIQHGGNFFASRPHLGNNLAPTLYQYSHSLIIWAVVFIAAWIYYKRPRFELLGWALHILIDIPSHSIGFYSTPFLFPLSDYRFPYGISWGNMWYMIINYSALLVLYIGLLVNKKRNKKVYN